jgi:hypothetical protein
MRRAFGIAVVASLALLMPVIAQIGGRPMLIMVARVSGPVNDPEIPGGPPPFMLGGARLAAAPGGSINAEMALRALQMREGARFTHNAVYFRFRVVPPPPPAPNAMIQIAADGSEANIQNRQFMAVDSLMGGGKGAVLIFRARAQRYDSSTPPNRVEQQGTVLLQIEDHAPGASQRPNAGSPPDRVATLIYVEGAYAYTYSGVVAAGDIYTHRRFIPLRY